MARTKYREHLAMCYAVQNKGNNLTELEEFAPGTIKVEGGVVYFFDVSAHIPLVVNTTDWLLDDPYVGFIKPITDVAFKARFDPAPISG